MRNFIFLGPPGCGKGTQSALISSQLDYVKLSTGDSLRAIASLDTELGRKIHNILTKGDFVSDEMVNQIIDNFYINISAQNQIQRNVILDGYPRSVKQAEALEVILNNHNTQVNKVFYFDVSDEVLIKRITGRYTCNDCGEIYNSFFCETIVPGKCDKCGSIKLNKRSDDSSEVVINRLEIFKNSTKPLLEFYDDKLVNIDAEKAAEVVSKQIIQYLS